MRYRLEGHDGRLIGFTWFSQQPLFGEVLRLKSASGQKMYRVLEIVADGELLPDGLVPITAGRIAEKTLKVVQIAVDEKNLEFVKEAAANASNT